MAGVHPTAPSDVTIVAPTPLPWTDDERLDRDALASNVERWGHTSLSGHVVGSGGGEETYISDDELFDAATTVAEARAPGKLLIGGIDTPSVTEALRRAERFALVGADLVRVRIPQTPQGGSRGHTFEYFAQVAEGSPIPVVVIHQTWQTGGFAATPEEIGAVCSLDNVSAYISWQNIRYESFVRRFVPPELPFWGPNGTLLLSSVAMGANGACCFFANWAPELVRQIVELGLAGRFAEAQSLQQSLVWADYLGMQHGVAALKAGLSLLGYEGSVPRAPVPALGAAERSELEAAFRVAGLLT